MKLQRVLSVTKHWVHELHVSFILWSTIHSVQMGNKNTPVAWQCETHRTRRAREAVDVERHAANKEGYGCLLGIMAHHRSYGCSAVPHTDTASASLHLCEDHMPMLSVSWDGFGGVFRANSFTLLLFCFWFCCGRLRYGFDPANCDLDVLVRPCATLSLISPYLWWWLWLCGANTFRVMTLCHGEMFPFLR